MVQAPNAVHQVKKLEKQIKGWMAPGTGFKSNQAAAVTRGKLDNSSLAGLRSFAGQPVTENLSEWRRGTGIVLTSLYRFKGLETDALTLADIVRPDPEAPPGASVRNTSTSPVQC